MRHVVLVVVSPKVIPSSALRMIRRDERLTGGMLLLRYKECLLLFLLNYDVSVVCF
jgi:hypothetical protein